MGPVLLEPFAQLCLLCGAREEGEMLPHFREVKICLLVLKESCLKTHPPWLPPSTAVTPFTTCLGG